MGDIIARPLNQAQPNFGKVVYHKTASGAVEVMIGDATKAYTRQEIKDIADALQILMEEGTLKRDRGWMEIEELVKLGAFGTVQEKKEGK